MNRLFKYRPYGVALLLTSMAAQSVACSDEPGPDQPITTPDAGADSAANPPPAVPPTGKPDAAPDASKDGEAPVPMRDAGLDATSDASPDAAPDGSPDAAPDANPAETRIVSYEVQVGNGRIAAGTTVSLGAIAVYSDGSRRAVANPEDLDWSSSSNAVASITRQYGPLAALGVAAGATTISAHGRTSGSPRGAATLTITDATVEAVAVRGAKLSLPKGESARLSAFASFDDGSEQDVSLLAAWTADPAEAVELNQDPASKGSVRTKLEGTVSIKASFGGKDGTQDLAVTAPVPVALTVPGDTRKLPLGTTMWLSADARLTDGTNEDLTNEVTWASSNPAVIAISNAGSKGFLTAVTKGTADITVTTFNGVTTTVNLAVSDAVIVETRVSPRDATIARGATRRLQLVAVDTTGEEINLSDAGEWSSSDTSIVTVSNVGRKGVVAAAKAGTAVISVQLGSKAYTADVVVQ